MLACGGGMFTTISSHDTLSCCSFPEPGLTLYANISKFNHVTVRSAQLQGTFTSQPVDGNLSVSISQILSYAEQYNAERHKGEHARLVWRTTTPELSLTSPELEDAAVSESAFRALQQHTAWEVSDTRPITEAVKKQFPSQLKWDNLHYLPVVYEQMNDLLLNMICDDNNRWSFGWSRD